MVGVAVVLASAEQQQPVFRGHSDDAHVFATVTDRNGRRGLWIWIVDSFC
jgi:hypothetical protein